MFKSSIQGNKNSLIVCDSCVIKFLSGIFVISSSILSLLEVISQIVEELDKSVNNILLDTNLLRKKLGKDSGELDSLLSSNHVDEGLINMA